MKTKLKLTSDLAIATRDQAESAISAYAQIAINLKRTTADMDAQIASIRARYQPNLDRLTTDLQAHAQALCDWAQTNPDQFPKNRRSLDFPNGTIGFRLGNPKLSLLNRSWTWLKVLANLKQVDPGFIRTKEEIDKEALLADYSQSGRKDTYDLTLKSVGLKVTQDESFYVDPNLTPAESRTTTTP